MSNSLDLWRRAAAWLCSIATVAMTIIAVVLQLRSPSGSSWEGGTNYLTLIHPIISVVIGAVIIVRKGNHLVGWLFCLSGLGWSLSHLAFSYSANLSRPGQLPWESQILWSSSWVALLAFGLAPVLILHVFPNGRSSSARWKAIFAAALGAVALGTIGTALAPGHMEDLPGIDNPYALEGAAGQVMQVLRELSWPLLLLSAAAGVWSVRVRARQGTSEERQQIKWILLAGMITVGFVLVWGVMETLGNTALVESINGLFVPLIPIAVGIAILKHRLYDIDLLINRTLVYASLSAILGGFYLGAVVLFQGLLAPLTAKSDLAIAASTLAVAALFGPLRTQVQRFIDRRFYRSRYDAAETLRVFSARLRDQVDLSSLSEELIGVVGATMQPVHASLWVRTPTGEATR
ncbi:MAG: hypothetical protein H0U53_07545 [Actinobacteria bacterium]|nr:hypothetical protein [Actinomycetota bacterium]